MNQSISRRELLTGFHKAALAATGVVAAGEAAHMVAHSAQEKPAEVITTGSPRDYDVPSLTFVHDARAYLVRDELGFFAIDAVCPHLGCLVKHVGDATVLGDQDGFVCPCHNSQYDARGAREHGPTPRSLRYLEVALDADERLVIHRDREVHSSDRLVA